MARGQINRSVSVLALAVALAGGCTLKTERFTADRLDVTPVSAPSLDVAAPDWRVGDQWTYSDGYGLAVTQVENGETVFQRTDAPEQWFSRKGFLRQDAQSATTLRSVVFRSIPVKQAAVLQGGEPIVFTREFTTKGVTRVHSTSWVIEGRATISVPAGDFDCYVIVMRTRNAETGWTGFERWWYAPEVRHYVRMEYRYGEKPVASRVLTSYTPNGAYVAAASDVMPQAPRSRNTLVDTIAPPKPRNVRTIAYPPLLPTTLPPIGAPETVATGHQPRADLARRDEHSLARQNSTTMPRFKMSPEPQ